MSVSGDLRFARFLLDRAKESMRHAADIMVRHERFATEGDFDRLPLLASEVAEMIPRLERAADGAVEWEREDARGDFDAKGDR